MTIRLIGGSEPAAVIGKLQAQMAHPGAVDSKQPAESVADLRQLLGT
jgi:hypothetical protein